MKTSALLFVCLLVAAMTGCQDEEYYPGTLDKVTASIVLSLDSLDISLETAAVFLASTDGDSIAARARLKELCEAVSFTKEFAFINNQGIMQVVEPSAYYPFEGTDFSDDDEMMDLIEFHTQVFTNFFLAREGYHAVADIHPVYDANHSFGAIEGLFTPLDLLDRICTPLVSPPAEVWIMEKTGTVVYDRDLVTIGLNVLTDPYYDPFPEVRTAGQKILAEETGKTSYTFYLTGTLTPVVKQAWWYTIHLHDNEWKVIWTEQENQ
ncbi:MAG TPA: hypothetical protein PKH94_08685 [Bacteroidales bacterium]|nr:hypothetical protein [Bacteroidales bacterium]HNS47299.1 hypothetical protein [Bacteroidales bacterium]